jgi:hypothetical protein
LTLLAMQEVDLLPLHPCGTPITAAPIVSASVQSRTNALCVLAQRASELLSPAAT